MHYIIQPIDAFGIHGPAIESCLGLTCCNVTCTGLSCSIYEDNKRIPE